MIDTYLCSENQTALMKICAGFQNILGPERGCVATEAFVDSNGNKIPAKPGRGDPAPGLFNALHSNS